MPWTQPTQEKTIRFDAPNQGFPEKTIRFDAPNPAEQSARVSAPGAEQTVYFDPEQPPATGSVFSGSKLLAHQEVQHEAVPLMHPNVGKVGQAPGGAPRDFIPVEATVGKPSKFWRNLRIFFFSHGAWAICALIGVMFIYMWFALPVLMGLILFAGAALVFIGILGRLRAGDNQGTMLCILCLIAFLLGTACGLYNYELNGRHFWTSLTHQEYSNVTPDEPAAAHADAGLILFSLDAKVDTARSQTFEGQSEYCAAPVISTLTGVVVTTVQYWAVGKDCCSPHYGFQCDDVNNPKARAGLVVRDSLFSQDGRFYAEAVKMGAEAYGLVPANHSIFVSWVHDVEGKLSSYIENAWWLWAEQMLYAYVAFVLASLFILLGGMDTIHPSKLFHGAGGA